MKKKNVLLQGVVLAMALQAPVWAYAGHSPQTHPTPQGAIQNGSQSLSGALSNANSTSIANSASTSHSAAVAGSQATSRNNNTVSASGGNAVSNGGTSTVGNVSSDSQGGASDSSSQSQNDLSISNVRNESTRPVNSAAPIFSVGCQLGASAQGAQAGINLIVDDAACQFLRLADAELSAFKTSRTDEEREFHWTRLNRFLQEAGDSTERSSATNTYAKNGANVGIGTIGFGVVGYILKMALMAF